MTMRVRYPRAFATSASPMPVLPAVLSTTSPPGSISPRCSAPRINLRAAIGKARGCNVRPGHHLASEDELEDGFILLVAGEIDDQRCIRQIGMPRETHLDQDVDFLVPQPRCACGFETRP